MRRTWPLETNISGVIFRTGVDTRSFACCAVGDRVTIVLVEEALGQRMLWLAKSLVHLQNIFDLAIARKHLLQCMRQIRHVQGIGHAALELEVLHTADCVVHPTRIQVEGHVVDNLRRPVRLEHAVLC